MKIIYSENDQKMLDALDSAIKKRNTSMLSLCDKEDGFLPDYVYGDAASNFLQKIREEVQSKAKPVGLDFSGLEGLCRSADKLREMNK